jgi:hypothetical protein
MQIIIIIIIKNMQKAICENKQERKQKLQTADIMHCIYQVKGHKRIFYIKVE